jgi:hypothetical protein
VAHLTDSQLERAWIDGGGSKAVAPLMAAIALAESGGNTDATNPTDNGGTQTSWGLWQISNGNHSEPSPQWNNPVENARLAVGKYHTQGLGAWGTYTSGAYQRFYRGGVPAGQLPQGGGGPGGGGQAGTAQLASFLSSPSGVLSDAGSLLHGSAVVLDRMFGLFAPGQGWRIVFGAAAAASGAGSFRAFRSGGDDGDGNLPVAILLAGIASIALFMMARPWPQTAAGAIRPGAYIVDVLKGQPPPSGPQAFSATEVHLTEAGLAALLALWAAGKAGQSMAGITAGAGALGKFWGWIKGLGAEAGTAAGDAAAAGAGEAL